ncbi:hypothetical protein [Pedobacter cryoconitis]|uniref:Lipoprotein n=1 Tax=Pedobacter cryoconitis TaxID=188932 RepID=A0A7X0MI82_9SPHI|nr:hypothetical protein [Pedobacter cryoconitis]MBB6499894.1 hypothetical protein [Pedobacter cryoconitis]
MDDRENKHSIQTTGLKILGFILCMSMTYACTQPKISGSNDKQKPELVKRSADDQLIIYLDSIASKFADQKFNAGKLKLLTDSFSRYFPLKYDQSGQSVVDSVISVDLRQSNDINQQDEVSLSLPYAIGSKLSFKKITAYFGPVTPRDPMVPPGKMPLPAIIDLKNHFKNRHLPLSLNITASDYPEAQTNQIVYIRIVKSKEK